MPATLYLVGSDKPYTTWQAAIDAVILDYGGTLTADVEIRGNAGETFPDGGVTHLMDCSGLNASTFRLTLAGENPNNPCILDRGDIAGSRFALVITKKFTFRGFKITLNKQDHTIVGSGNCDGSIVERNDIEARGSHMFNCGALSSLTPFIVRNNYFHGRDGVFRGSNVHRNNNENMIFVGNTYRHTARLIDAGGEWLNGDFIKWFDNVVYDQDSTTGDPGYGPADYGAFLLPGTLAQFNARWQANNNLYYSTVAPVLNLYNIPAQYTLAQYQALASTPDANAVTADPLLTSFADPHLGAGSPAIGAGVANANLGTDAFGITRSDPPDIGLYQFALATLYTVGTGKMFSALQAAWDAVVSDYGTLTANVEIRVTAGETLLGANALLTAGGLTPGAFRVTITGGGNLSNKAILDFASLASFGISMGTQKHVTIRGFQTQNLGSSQYTVYQGGDGAICEQCYFILGNDQRGVVPGDNNSTQWIIRNNYFRFTGTPGSAGLPVSEGFNVYVYNNTIRGFDLGFRNFNRGGGGNYVKNNIFHSCTTALGDQGGPVTLADFSEGCDFNLFFNCTHIATIDGVDYDTLAAWKAASIYDDNSVEGDPLLVSVSDPHLQEGSPAIDAGTALGDVTNDFDDDSRPQVGAYDIGADEALAFGPPLAIKMAMLGMMSGSNGGGGY